MAEESLLAGDDSSTPNDEQTTDVTTDTVAQAGKSTNEPAVKPWYVAEGVAGEGDKPDWYKDSKYKSVADQAKAYTDLEKKLGGFTGAPEGDYELSMPDGIEGEWIEGDPLMEGFQAWAKDNGLNQDKFTDLLHLYVKNEASTIGQSKESEIAALGANAKERLTSISNYAKANLSEEDYNGLLAATTTAAGVKAVEALIAQTKSPKIPTDMAEAGTGVTHAEIRARIADPKYQSDPAFRKETEKMYEQLLGSGPKRQIVG